MFIIWLTASEFPECVKCKHFPEKRAVDICDPFKLCTELGEGVKVPNPEDCHQYYICIRATNGDIVPSSSPIDCPESGYFDFEKQNCISDGNTCREPCLNFGCSFECEPNKPTPYPIADRHDCSVFYVCVAGSEPVKNDCSGENPYFNGSSCQNNPFNCCEGCTPYCQIANSETLDPFDCEKYYLCEEVGIPDENHHFSCEPGQYFEPSQGFCVPITDVACSALCSISTTLITVISTSDISELSTEPNIESTEEFSTQISTADSSPIFSTEETTNIQSTIKSSTTEETTDTQSNIETSTIDFTTSYSTEETTGTTTDNENSTYLSAPFY